MIRAFLLVAIAALAAAPAAALESSAVTSARATVTFASETDAIDGKPFRLGLHFRLAPGWHIYWTNPGDAGMPPELHLTLPDGATASALSWPTPTRLAEATVMTYAYTGEVLLPLTVTPGGTGAMAIDADASWLVCQKICVPEQGKLHLDLPSGTPAPSAEAPLFAATDAHLPQPSPFAATIAPDGTLSLAGPGLSRATVADAWFFPTVWGAIDQGAAQRLSIGPDRISLSLARGSAFDPTAKLTGVVVLKDPKGGESALEVAAVPGAAPSGSGTGFGEALVFALLGGLILNLMPCVFPVLAMKAMALARLSGAARGEVRAHALSYTGGVLVAFGALGGLLIALRSAGDAVGWGFQFHSPVFVVAMAWLLFAIGLNLSGVYTVGGSVMGAGQGLTERGGHLGSFFTGLVAVLVATPCTAPFMGAALAAALTAPAVLTMVLFLTLGLGLALPYAVLALAPGLARRLPRPGRWMDVLKQALAFPMYGAAAWLVWVVSQQSTGVLAALGGIVLLGFALWAYGLAAGAARIGRRVAQGAAVAGIAGALALLMTVSTSPAAPAAAASADWEPFSAARLASLRAEGRPVFVDMTAAWCVTCLVNERVALSRDDVRAAFGRHRVAYLKGDWTREDPEISRFLRGHDRDGVPLYVYYPPGGAAEILPQILTEALVLDEVNRLGS